MCVSVYFTATISLSETSSINVYCLINGSPISSFLLHLPKALNFHSRVISSLSGVWEGSDSCSSGLRKVRVAGSGSLKQDALLAIPFLKSLC